MSDEETQDDGPDTLLPQVIEATAGEYEILGELGRGGMAAVYLANDLSLNRKVAIKTMLPELIGKGQMVQRFKREAQMAGGLSHPHIVQIHSVKQTKQIVYFVMKYIEGRSLGSIIEERGALDLDSARLIMQQAGSALSFAHHRGIIHRDVKPANIMIDENGWAIVTDFGIAKQDTHQLTATGQAVGTPHYMSPEQFGDKPITPSSDQYALGIVAYEMLTGQKPFGGTTFAEIITQQLFKDPPDIRTARPDLPEAAASTVARMLHKDSAQRFPDLDAAIAAFGQPQNVDVVRGQLTALARSGQRKSMRLSVPMSPIPMTRPSVKTTLVNTGDEKATPRVAPAAPAPVPKRKSGIWIVTAVFALIVVGAVVVPRMRRAPAGVSPARAALARGDLDLARDEALKAVQRAPRNAAALKELGAVMVARNDYESARRFFIRALEVDPTDKFAMGWLSCSLWKLGVKDRAQRFSERAGPGDWSNCLK